MELCYDELIPETVLQASFRCPHWKQTVAFLRCTVCKQYDRCTYLKEKDREVLLASPFIKKTIEGFEGRRIIMHIAATKKGDLQVLPPDIFDGAAKGKLTPEQEQELLQMMIDGKLNHLLVIKEILKPALRLEPLPKEERDKVLAEMCGQSVEKTAPASKPVEEKGGKKKS
jgi:hypothetical protein